MTDAADQPTILDILSEYLSPEDLPKGEYGHLLDKLRDRDIVMITDAHERGLRAGYKKIRREINILLEDIED